MTHFQFITEKNNTKAVNFSGFFSKYENNENYSTTARAIGPNTSKPCTFIRYGETKTKLFNCCNGKFNTVYVTFG